MLVYLVVMSDKKHIVIDAREYSTSTGRYISKLIEYLEKIDTTHEYTVLLLPHDYGKYQPSNKNFRKKRAPFKEFTFSEQIGYVRFLNKLGADLVHFGMTHQPILYNRPAITTVHDLTTARFRNPATPWLIFKIKQLVYHFVIWVVAHKSKHIITPSTFVKDDLVTFARISANKITVTHEAADKVGAKAEPIKELQGKQFIMYVGRPQPHKNLRRLVDAFAKLKHTYPELYLVLAGKKDAVYQQHLDYIERSSIKDVLVTGFVSEGELRWLYEHTAAYVFPSLSEGFGLPALEAMAHGAPVVSSSATCLPEIYRDGALYFDPENTADIVEKVAEVLDHKKVSQALIDQGKDVAKSYSWQRMAEQTLAIYKKVLED